MRHLICIMILVSFLGGCTTTQKGTVTGAGIGGLAGGVIGHNRGGKSAEGAAIGAALGALGGALTGSIMENRQKDEQIKDLRMAREYERREAIERSKQSILIQRSPVSSGNWVDGHKEFVTKTQWVDTTTSERVWVREYWDGNRRIEAHYETRKIPSGHWKEYEEEIWVPGHYEEQVVTNVAKPIE